MRVADGLDRTHGGVVRSIAARIIQSAVELRLSLRGEGREELWFADKKADLFREVFGALTLRAER